MGPPIDEQCRLKRPHVRASVLLRCDNLYKGMYRVLRLQKSLSRRILELATCPCSYYTKPCAHRMLWPTTIYIL